MTLTASLIAAAAPFPAPLAAEEAPAVAEAFAATLFADAAERERIADGSVALVASLRAAGLLGIQANGASARALAEVVRHIATADAALAVILLDHFATSARTLTAADDAQRPAVRRALLNGDRFASGTNHDLRIVRQAGRALLDGTVSNVAAPIEADWILLDRIEASDDTILINLAQGGFEHVEQPERIGLRGLARGGLSFAGSQTIGLLLVDGALAGGLTLLADLLRTAALLGIAEAAFRDTADFTAARTRPWYEAEGQLVGQEQSVLFRMGQLAVELRAARVLHARAAMFVDDHHVLAEGAIREAAGVAADLALAASNELFAISGASAADEVYNHGRHWRDARTLTAGSTSLVNFRRAGELSVAAQPSVRTARDITGSPTSPPLIGSAEEAIAVAHDYAAAIRINAVERDRAGRFPSQELRLLAASGLLGITVPRAYGGGAEVSLETVIEILRILAKADSSIGQIPQGQFGTIGSLRKGGSEEQKRFFFAEALRGARFGNAAAERFVEQAKIVKTRLTRSSSGSYRLNGRKYYSTGSPEADWVSVLALDEADQPIVVLVPKGAKGFEVLDDWDAMGQRGTGSGTTLLDDVAIDPIQILPPWFQPGQPSVWAAVANIKHVAAHLGVAEAAFDDLVALLRQQDAPLDPLVLHRVGRLAARLHAGQDILRDGARHLERVEKVERLDHEAARLASLDITEGKVFIGETAIEIADELFALAGPAALDADAGYDRHWRNIRTHTLHDPNRWRYIRAGDFLLNGNLPPANRNN